MGEKKDIKYVGSTNAWPSLFLVALLTRLRCVIIGDSGVGKTSLLITRTTKVFPENAPKLLELEKTTIRYVMSPHSSNNNANVN
jgi:GTPase SAR1 family protein